MELNPSLVDFMMLATSKLRWDEQNTMPHTQVSELAALWIAFLYLEAHF